MKLLNKESTKILKKMIKMMDDDDYIKIDNSEGTFMSVIIEKIFENGKYQHFSVAHYYLQNGDLMADPEMIFIRDKITDTFIPSYYRQDSMGVEEESIEMRSGEIHGVKMNMQSGHTYFADHWLKNIKLQQNL